MAKPLAKLVTLITPKRRWAQFSLATLLLVVTMLCVGLSLVIAPAERQRRAVAAIEAIGGVVVYQEPNPSRVEALPGRALRLWLPRAYFDKVLVVSFPENAEDSDLTHLQSLTAVQTLSLSATQVTDTGLARLRGMTWLKFIWLRGATKVTRVGIAGLRKSIPECHILEQ
jgi:hypothetical protein